MRRRAAGASCRRRSRRSATRRAARATRVVTAGLDAGDVRAVAWAIEPDGAGDASSSTACDVRRPLRGVHNLRNAMLALAVARELGRLDRATPRAASRAMPSPPMRVNVRAARRRATLINDAYNSNPGSARAALELLGTPARGAARRRARHDARARRRRPTAARRGGARRARGAGRIWWSVSASSPTRSPASRRATRASSAARIPRAVDGAPSRLAPDAVILLKASRGVRLERLVPLDLRVGGSVARPDAARSTTRSTDKISCSTICSFRSSRSYTRSTLQLHHLPRGRRGGDGASCYFIVGPLILKRLDDGGQLSGGPRGHAGLAPAKVEDADDGRPDLPLRRARATLLWARVCQPLVLVALIVRLWMGGIGFLDDYLKLKQKRLGRRTKGSSSATSSIGQVTHRPRARHRISGCIPLSPNCPAHPRRCRSTSTCSSSPTLLGWLYVLFMTFVLTGTSNAVNLTDGLDGLAAGLSARSRSPTFAVFAYVIGRVDASAVPAASSTCAAPASSRSSASRWSAR